ncbi:MAG: hypothetical protein H0V07_04750 [Propionibacteriales bacterium]|nr:hypothetical protein [Propionibacteriales bacterium]
MVTSRQRQRQLARARWERQQTRRSAESVRNRRIGIIAGIVVAVLAAAALVWLVLHIVNAEDTRNQQQQTPTTNLVPTAVTPSAPGTTADSLPGTTPDTSPATGSTTSSGATAASPSSGVGTSSGQGTS